MVWQAAARANRLAVRPPVLPLCLSAGRQARGQAGRQAGGQGCQPDGRKACRPFRLQRKGTFAKVVSLRRCVAAFGSDVAACGVVRPPLPPLSLSLPPFAHLLIPTVPLRSCLYAPVPAGRHKGRQGCRRKGKDASPTAGRRAGHSDRKGKGLSPNLRLCPCVAAFGADVVACGVPQPLSDPDLPPTFAPKRQGNAPGAYRRPRLRPSFGQPEGIGRPIPSQVGNDRFTPNRRTKQEQSQARLNYVLQGGGRVTLNPSATDFCVL